MKKNRKDEDIHFMNVALDQARKALDKGDFPVGCVIVHDRKIVAEGFRRNSSGVANELDHAEILALRALRTERPEIDTGEVVVYSTMEPCLMCYATLLVNGIRTIVYGYEDAMGGGTSMPLNKLSPLYRECRMKVTAGVLRSECLSLFKEFFSNPNNSYLQDSYLARYTLEAS